MVALPEITVTPGDTSTQAPQVATATMPVRQSVPPTPIGGPKDIATLIVRGELFTNWTSIRLEQRISEAFPTFQFECTEPSAIPLDVDMLQFVPGDVVSAFVGGVPALFGYITERHVAYDAKQHSVRLIGCGDTVDLTQSMVPLEKLGNHDGKNWAALAQDLMSHLGIRLLQVGNVDATPFKNIQVQPGEVIQSIIERYAKMRNIVLGSNATGGLLAIGENPAISTGSLIEGYNILRANCVIRDPQVYRKIFTMGQNTSSDEGSGDPQNKMVAELDGTSTRNRMMVTVADVADTMHGIQRRTQMEKVFTEGSKIEAQITLQGWFKDNNTSDEVWRAGEYYYIESADLILHGVYGCAGCVYEQSDAGTTTTLTMVDPQHMNGTENYRDIIPGYIAAAQQQQADLMKATTPPPQE